jgi:hypothetical protein
LNFKVNTFTKSFLLDLQHQLEICKAYQENEKIYKKKSWLNKNYRALWRERELDNSFISLSQTLNMGLKKTKNIKHRLRA